MLLYYVPSSRSFQALIDKAEAVEDMGEETGLQFVIEARCSKSLMYLVWCKCKHVLSR